MKLVTKLKTMPELYRIIDFKIKHGNCGGSLVQFQPGGTEENALPFPIGKVLVSSDMQSEDVRGNHAHHATEEIVVALSGGCTFELDDGRGTRERVRLGVGACGSSDVDEFGSNTHTPLHPDADTHSAVDPLAADSKPALLLHPHVWRTFYDFDPGTVLLVVANIKYDESDYIRDRAEFERLAKDWCGLGGSSAQGAGVVV